MTKYNQLNLYDNDNCLLIPTSIDLDDFLNDAIKLIKEERQQKVTQNFDKAHHRIMQCIDTTLAALRNLQQEIAPQIEQMQTIDDNNARSTQGTLLSQKYQPQIDKLYHTLTKQINDSLKNIIGDYTEKISFRNVSYRHVNILITEIKAYAKQFDRHCCTETRHRLLNRNLYPETHLSKQTFLDKLIIQHPEYSSIKLIQINDSFIVLEEITNNDESLYRIDYEDRW